ncbi:hypothetical protein ULMS_18470 [Patiriisocius marinistellae]|uniref:Uncharacterized protein n=1 Tax=Patiriisocius marinistellae TaxID=2494560 RepID=A0A5J4G164_9FLAO|nr:hypothetical protein ULMS_18470 [Patiriisocius marinistellae]
MAPAKPYNGKNINFSNVSNSFVFSGSVRVRNKKIQIDKLSAINRWCFKRGSNGYLFVTIL